MGTLNGIVLGRATLADVDELLALWAIAAENDARPADSADAVRALLVRDADSCLVARREGQIVGTLIAGWDGWRAHLYRLAVHPDMRRHGLGRALLDAGEQRLRALGATRFDAMVLGRVSLLPLVASGVEVRELQGGGGGR